SVETAMIFEIGGAVDRDRRSIGSIVAVLLCVIACLGAPVAAAGECAPVEDAIVQAGFAHRIAAEDVRAFYEDADGACVWDPANAHLLIETVRSAGEHGLDPLLFHAEQLSDIASDDPYRAAERDVLLTDA